MRLHNAMIFVKDLERMTSFYAGTLGLTVLERLENWVEFDAGGARFALHAIPPQIADRIEISSLPKPRESNAVKLTFEVDDAASERSRLESLGVPIIDRSWGSWDALDPEGNVFAICERRVK